MKVYNRVATVEFATDDLGMNGVAKVSDVPYSFHIYNNPRKHGLPDSQNFGDVANARAIMAAAAFLSKSDVWKESPNAKILGVFCVTHRAA